MKTTISSILIFCWIFVGAQSSWKPLGPDDFNQASVGPTNSNSDIVDSNRLVVKNGIVYVVNVESSLSSSQRSYMLNVFNGFWSHFKSPFTSSSNLPGFEVRVDSSGSVYLMCFDEMDANKLKLAKFDGNSWVLVGGTPLSETADGAIRLELDPDDKPVVYYGESGQAVVKKFDGTSWVAIPSTDIEPSGFLKIDSAGNIFIAYGTSGNQTIVKKYTGSFWEEVGLTGFANGPTTFCLQNDLPVVASGQTIRKFDGTGWATLPFLSNYYSSMRLSVDANNSLYASYTTTELISKRIQKLNGSSWTTVKNQVSYGPLSIGFDGGTLYELFTKTDNYPLVMKQAGNNWFYLGHQSNMLGTNHDMTLFNDYPLVCYQKNSLGVSAKLFISRYDISGVWTESQTAVSESVVLNSRMGKDNLGNVYVAYLNDINSSYYNPNTKVTVKKSVGNSWEVVGGLNFSLEAGQYFDFAFNNANEPHVIYKSGRVQKFNGSTWELVGGTAFNGDLDVKMAFSPTDELYVMHEGVSVKKRNGNGWEFLDQATLSNFPGATLPQILFDGNDLWIAFLDSGKNIHVMKNVFGNWVQMGATIETQVGCTFMELKTDNNHVPTLIFNPNYRCLSKWAVGQGV